MARTRVAVYVTRIGDRGTELLSFAHRDFPEAGIQIPAGGVEPDEDLESAARRECLEETGIVAVRELRALGVQSSPHPVTGQERVTVFFHAVLDQPAPGLWTHVVGSEGTDDGMVFDCSFAPLDDVTSTLVDGQHEFAGRIPSTHRPPFDDAMRLLRRLRDEGAGTAEPATQPGANLLVRSGQALRADGRITLSPIGSPKERRSHQVVPDNVVDLSSGNPDEQLLPDLDALAKAAEPVPVLYGEPHVVPSFSAAFEDYLRSEGLRAQAMIPLPGGLFAVEFVLSTLLEPGSRVAVESPGHQGDVLLLRSLGLVEVPVRVDRHGMIPEDLDAVVAGLDAVLLRPRAQNPTGAALSEERAAEVGRVLADRDVLVVAEDHCGPVSGVPFRSPAAPGHALALTIHSFSKWIGPDLRCAVVTGDAFLIDVLGRRRLLGGGWVSRRTQALIAAALTDPAARELRQVARETYAARRNALVEALAAHAIVGTGDSGLNVYVRVPDERRVAEHLARSGWLVGTGACHGGREDALRLTVAALPATDAKLLAEHVAEAVIRDARS